ncbi:MAG TPA: TonB family protein [Longimicrobiaceae bacterium]|jgi:TonB family protein|nr:TonB family protein [Longimicrobiaceae bacterium]
MSGIEGLLAGRTLAGRYSVEKVIGRGGMGAVYRATDERLGRPVAVKVMMVPASDADSRERVRQRFLREAQAAARLRHPNVVTVHDFGVDEELGLDYLVMELLEGEDLAAAMARAGRMPPATALGILGQAASGLAAGHRAGMVHRDVKPGNLFLETGEQGGVEVRVLDFGIAQVAFDDLTLTHVTVAGRGPLSPAYASPEQLAGERRLTPASDVFSLGAVALYLLTGERPLTGGDPGRTGDEVDAGIAAAEGVPGVTPALVEVLRRAMSTNPTARFADGAAFREALDAVRSGDDATALHLAAEPPPGAPFIPLGAPVVEGPDRRSFPRPPEDATEFAPAPSAGSAAARHSAGMDTHPAEPAASPVGVVPRRRSRAWIVPLLLLLAIAAAAAYWLTRPQPQPVPAPVAVVDSAAIRDSLRVADSVRIASAAADTVIRRDSVARAELLRRQTDSVRQVRDSAAAAAPPPLPPPPVVDPNATYTLGELDAPPALRNRDEMARLLDRRYPSMYRNQGGNVTIRLTIDTEGRVDKGSIAVVSSSSRAFEDPARQVAERMRFQPATRAGQPVRARLDFPIVWQPTQ